MRAGPDTQPQHAKVFAAYLKGISTSWKLPGVAAFTAADTLIYMIAYVAQRRPLLFTITTKAIVCPVKVC